MSALRQHKGGFFLAASLLVWALNMLFPNAVLAETFDYDGSALVDCVCPSPWGNNSCGVKRRDTFDYTLNISVRKNMSLNLSNKCFDKRDRDACCDDPRASYRGVVAKDCPGKRSCS